jgi:hypothetical protein
MIQCQRFISNSKTDDVELDRPPENPQTGSISDPKTTDTPRIARADLMNATPIRMEAPEQHSFSARRGHLPSILGDSYPDVVEDAHQFSKASIGSKTESESLRQMRSSALLSARFPIEESMDSLSLFAVLHQGRLPMNTHESDVYGKEEEKEDPTVVGVPRKKWSDRPVPMIKGFDQVSVNRKDISNGKDGVQPRLEEDGGDRDEEDTMYAYAYDASFGRGWTAISSFPHKQTHATHMLHVITCVVV